MRTGHALSRSLSWLRSVNWCRVLLALLLLSGVVAAYVEFDPAKLQEGLVWIQHNKTRGWILFLLAYTLGVVLMLPAMVLGMLSGAAFGLLAGTALGWVGCSVGQVIAFVIGRYLLREPVTAYLTRQFPQWSAIDKALETEAWKLITLLRLSPLAPWNVLNYALAVTSVPLTAYALASSLSILPYLGLFVYAGSLARSLADVFAGNTGLDATTTLVVALASGVIMVVAVWYTTRVSRHAISKALLSHADTLPPELTTDADVVALLRVAEFAGDDVAESPLGSLFGTSPRPDPERGPKRSAHSWTHLAEEHEMPGAEHSSGPATSRTGAGDVELGAWRSMPTSPIPRPKSPVRPFGASRGSETRQRLSGVTDEPVSPFSNADDA